MARIDEKHVLAIWGAPHGGKTTIAANMATILADSGYMTCLVSANECGELQAFFGTAIPSNKGIIAAVSNGRNVRDALVEVRPNLCLLEMDTGGDSYEVEVTQDHVLRIISELRDQFTYVIIDCTNLKESVFTGLGLVEADKVVISIPHNVKTAMWHIANKQMLEAIGAKTLYVDSDIILGGTDIEVLLDSIGLPSCPIRIRNVKSAAYCENSGRLIVHQSGREEKRYKKAIMDLIKLLLSLEEEDTTSAKANKAKKDKGGRKRDDDDDDEPSSKKKSGLFGGGKKDKGKSAKPSKGKNSRDYDDDDEEDEDYAPRGGSRGRRDDDYDDDENEAPRRSRHRDDDDEEDDYDDRRGRSRRPQRDYDDDEEDDEDDKPRRNPFKRELTEKERYEQEARGRQKRMTPRQMRQAEEEAMRRAQEDQRRGYKNASHYDDDEDDYDD